MNPSIRIANPAPDVVVFTGATFESTATAFLAGDDTLLVDTLANEEEARAVKQYLLEMHSARVAQVVLSHFMDDHTNGLKAFPDAQVMAHPLYKFTHALGRTSPPRSSEVAGLFPTRRIESRTEMSVGSHRLTIFPNPGKTVCMLNVDAPSSDLVIAGDNLIGRIVYLSSSVPEQIVEALHRLQQTGRRSIVCGHQGVHSSDAISDAIHYVNQLRRMVTLAHAHAGDWRSAVLSIPIESCLAETITPTAFETHWHGENLKRVVERHLFRVVYN